MRGIGWVVLYQDGERLVNFWVNEHDVANPAGCAPVLVMDVFEHAFAEGAAPVRTEVIHRVELAGHVEHRQRRPGWGGQRGFRYPGYHQRRRLVQYLVTDTDLPHIVKKRRQL